eukprot:Selendium_serpulae@DN5496_c0_g1_i1.p1
MEPVSYTGEQKDEIEGTETPISQIDPQLANDGTTADDAATGEAVAPSETFGADGEEDSARKTDDPSMDDQQSNPAKVFVGGLGQGTTNFSLRGYFSQYGSVSDAAVVHDKMSGRSRGFGFCTFEHSASAERCLNARHKIDGVSCEVRRAVPRDEARAAAPYDTIDQPSKLFVGGLSEDILDDRLKEYFEQFGTIKQATLMYDKTNHRPRGFGFIIFENQSDCNKAIGQHPDLGRQCEAKKAEPRTSDRRGGRGGFRGGFEGRDRFDRWDDRRGGRDMYGPGGRFVDSRGYGPPDSRGARGGRYGGPPSYRYDSQPYQQFCDPYGYYTDPGYFPPGQYGGYGMYGYDQSGQGAAANGVYQSYGQDSYGNPPGAFGGQPYGVESGYGGQVMTSRAFGPQRAGGRYGNAMVRATPY